jgi:hypothetical protein
MSFQTLNRLPGDTDLLANGLYRISRRQRKPRYSREKQAYHKRGWQMDTRCVQAGRPLLASHCGSEKQTGWQIALTQRGKKTGREDASARVKVHGRLAKAQMAGDSALTFCKLTQNLSTTLRKVVDTHNGSDLVCTSYENQWPRKN